MLLDEYIEDLRDAIYGDALNEPLQVVIGDDTTPVVSTDTALGNEVLRGTSVNGKVSTDIASYVATFSTAQGNGTYFTEAGVVDTVSPTGGVLACRKVFPAFLKSVNYSLRVSVFIKVENTS